MQNACAFAKEHKDLSETDSNYCVENFWHSAKNIIHKFYMNEIYFLAFIVDSNTCYLLILINFTYGTA